MTPLDSARLARLIIHQVGNRLADEGVRLSQEEIDLNAQPGLKEILTAYFLSPFKEPVYYHFHHVSSRKLNEIHTVAGELFQSTRGFVRKSRDIANILYQYSNHPRIRTGELYIAYFENCRVGDRDTDALGIFKSENKETFLKILDQEKGLGIAREDGVNIRKPDKGCLIFNVDAGEGYRVCVVDTLNLAQEAQYWKDEFLKLKPIDDNYDQTRNYLNLAREFVTGRLDEDFEVSRADQIDYLNRSLDYFKKHDQFNEHDFANEVFEDKEVIQSFRDYKKHFQQNNLVRIVPEFDISTPAVRRQSRVFKSVLKLDRNFHIYIHGNRDLIESGVDPDGRKYYKIYYREES